MAPRDLNAREHLAMWPLVALMLVMGVASPVWMKTLDVNATEMALKPVVSEPVKSIKVESETYAPATFVDPNLKQAVDVKNGKASAAVTAPEGRRY